MNRLTRGALALGFGALLCLNPLTASTGTAGAQTTLPTTPCPGCGPSGGTIPPGSGQRAWSFPEHTCVLDEATGVVSSNFHVVFGTVGAIHPVRFSVTVDNLANGTPLVRTALGTVQPGSGTHTSGFIVRVFPLTKIQMVVTATDTVTGQPVAFGRIVNGQPVTSKVDQLVCDCEQPPAVTIPPPPTGPPATPPTLAPPTSVGQPGTPDSPPSTGVPGTPPGTLPATGPFGLPTEDLVLTGALAFVVGAFVLLSLRITRKAHVAEWDDQ